MHYLDSRPHLATRLGTIARRISATTPLLTLALAYLTVLPALGTPVQVVVDMDMNTPGIQSNVAVLPGDVTVTAAVYIFDPLGTRTIWSIGYLGGIDRSMSFGHVPNNTNGGSVVDLVGHSSTPVHPDNFGLIIVLPGQDKGFPGPEVQYAEWGSKGPALMPSTPNTPVFTADVEIEDGQMGDVYDFYLLDFVTIWSEGMGGAFSTTGPITLDTGGDVVADGTVSSYGTDVDSPLPVPPAAFEVDYIDGGGGNFGPATIRVATSTAVAETAPESVRLHLHQNVPNPFNPFTTIRFDLASHQHARVSIHDANGRTVRMLIDNALPAGSHATQWNGIDAGGKQVASGVYFMQLSTEQGSMTRTLVLAR